MGIRRMATVEGAAPERVQIDLEEAARLELQGAWHRLFLAKRALQFFLSERNPDDTTPELRKSLDRELNGLEVEVDAAQRAHAAAKQEFIRLRRLRGAF